ncbi:hypothetical protein D3C86_1898770 [compost metagenome]
MVFGSSLPETLAGMGMGECAAVPGMAVIISLAPENLVSRFSEKCSSIFAGAAPSAPSAGVEDSSFGWAWARPLTNRPVDKATATTAVLMNDMQGLLQLGF